MASITSTGLGSGLNISELVSQLVAAERTPAVSRLDRQEGDLQAKISSYGNFKSVLSAFRDSLTALKKLSTFQNLSATSSDEEIIKASVQTNADLGTYRLEATQLAQNHALASEGYSSTNTALGTGTLTIKFGTDPTGSEFVQNGDKGSISLVIDETNNTLTGIRDAINKANGGVNAAVVYDGSAYRLALSSTDSGAKNSMQISGLAALNFNADVANNKMVQTQTGQDAKLKINGLEVSSPSNTVSDALKGLTLDLQKAEVGKVVTVSVSQDNAAITKSVETFVNAFNELSKAVKSMTGYDAATKSAGTLLGDATVRGAMSQLRAALSRFVPGLTGTIRTLGDIGLKTNSDGTLSLDGGKLNKALAADRDSVAAVFSTIGRPSDKGVTYLDISSDTQAGEYALNITQAATQGTFSGTSSLTFPFTVDASNKVFKLSVDGVQSGDISLTEGSYSDSALVAEIQSRINGDGVLKAGGVAVKVTLDDSNRLLIASKTYGSASQISVTQASSALGLTVGSGVAGKDLAGTIGGEVAQGTGQELTAISGPASGLKLLIEDGKIGDRGTVSFSRGLIESLDKLVGGLLDRGGGISARTEGIQKSLEKIQKEREKLDDRMAELEKRLLDKFNAMDALLAQLQSTSTYLTQQLASLPLSSTSSNDNR